jgi:hypothetical protein
MAKSLSWEEFIALPEKTEIRILLREYGLESDQAKKDYELVRRLSESRIFYIVQQYKQFNVGQSYSGALIIETGNTNLDTAIYFTKIWFDCYDIYLVDNFQSLCNKIKNKYRKNND